MPAAESDFVPREHFENLTQINAENYAKLDKVVLMIAEGELMPTSVAAQVFFADLVATRARNGKILRTADGVNIVLVDG